MNNRKCQFLHFFRQKNLIFEVVAEISGNMMSNIYPEMSGDTVSANFIDYSWSYKFLKISKILKTGARFQNETGLWTGTLKMTSVERND